MQLTLDELKTLVAEYVSLNKISVNSFIETSDNIVGLLDEIGKKFTIDTGFFDKLTELDGEDLPYGKTIEEWYQDLILPQTYSGDTEGTGALKFYSPTYRPVCYSYTLGRKYIPESIPNNNIERAVNNYDQFNSIVMTEYKRIQDSRAVYKYQIKREALGKVADLALSQQTSATTYVASSTTITEGNTYTDGTTYAVAVQSQAASSSTFSALVDAGVLVPLNIITKIAAPTSTETGEAFYIALKEAIEKAKDVSEGYSFNGNTIGAEEGLYLYVAQGVMPTLEVQTLAGAFHLDQVAPSVAAKVIKDFGDTTSGVFAILMDKRAVRLHTDYEALRQNFNGLGDFLNLFLHLEYTAHISRNAFFKVFIAA